MSAGSKQSVYGSMSDEKDGGDTPLSKRGSINFSNDESSKNLNISDMKARVNSFYEMPLTKSSSKSGAIDKEAKYEGGGGGSTTHTAVPPLVRKPSNMVALDRRKQYATSQNNSDISCDDTDGRGRPLSTASSCMSMKSNHSRRPSKMGKKSSMDLLDDESSSNFTTVYAESEGRSMRSSGMSLKAASQLALEGSPNIITLPYPSPVPAFISPTPHTTHKPSSYSLMKSSRSQSQIPAPSSINSSTSGIQGSKSHEIKARRNSSRGPENEVYLPTTIENVLPLKTSSRRNSYSSTLPVWPLPRTSSKSSSRRASVTGSNNGMKDSSSTESIEPVIEVDRLRDEKTYMKPHAIEKLDELLAFPLSPSTSAPVSHSSEYVMENKIALSSPEYVESIDTLSTKSSLSSYVMQQASKDCSSAASKECSPAASKECSPAASKECSPGAEAVVPTDVKHRESHVATSSSPIPSTTAPSAAPPATPHVTTAAGGMVGTALLAVTAATLSVNPSSSLRSRDNQEQGEVNKQGEGERGGGGEERATTPTPTMTASSLMKDALPSTGDQQQHTCEMAANTLLNVTKSSSLLMEVDTDSSVQSPSVLPVRSPTQAFLMGSFEDDDDVSYSNEIETPAGALEARFYDDDEESNVDFLSIPSISPIQSPASRSTMHMTSGFVKTNNPNPIPSDLSRSLDLSEVNAVGDGSLSESSSYFKDFMSPSVASTLPSDYGNTPSARRDVGWDSPYPNGQSNSPSPIPSVDTSSTLQVHNHPMLQGRTGQTPPSKQAKGQVHGQAQGQGQGGDDDKYISLDDSTTGLRTGDNALLPRIQTSSHSLSNGSDDNLEDSLVCSEMESEVPMSPEWFESGSMSMMNSVKSKKGDAPMSPEWFEAEALVGAAAEKKIVAPMSPEWFEAEASAMMNSSAVKNIEVPMSPEWFEGTALIGAATSSSSAAVAVAAAAATSSSAAAVAVERKSEVAMSIAIPTATAATSSSATETDASATLSTASAADIVTSFAPPSKRPSLKCVVLFTPSPHPQQLPTKGLCSPPVFGDGQVKTTTLESILGDKLAPYATGAALALPKSASASPAQSYSPPQTSAGKSSRIPVFDGKSWKVARSTDVSPIRSPSEEPLGTRSPHTYGAPLRKAVMEPLPAASVDSMNARSPRVYSMPQKKLYMDPSKAVTGDNNAEVTDRIYSLPLRRAGASSGDVSPIHTPPGDLSSNHTANLGKGITGDAFRVDRDLLQAVNSASTTSQGPRGQGDDLSDSQSTLHTAPVTKQLASMTDDHYSSGKEVDNTFLSAPATSSTTRPPRPAEGLKILISPKAGADMIPHPENPELVKPPTPVGNSWPAMEVASDGTAQGDITQDSSKAASMDVNTGTGTGTSVGKVVAGTVAVAAVAGVMSSTAMPGSPAFKLPPLQTPSLSPLLESLLADSPLRGGLPENAPESDRVSRTYSGEGVDRAHDEVATMGTSSSHHTPVDHNHYDVDEEDDEEDESSTVTTIVSKDNVPFVSKSAADRGLPARRGPPSETPSRGTAVPLSGLDLSSPTPTESDLDYAGYDMGDQTDQLEGIIDCSAPFFADDNPMKSTLPQRKNSFIEFGGDLGIKLRVEQRGGYKPRSASRDEMDWHSKHSEDEDDEDDGLSYIDSGSHSVGNNGNHDYDLYEREREKERIRELVELDSKLAVDYPPKPVREEVDKNGMRRKNLRKVESVEELLGPSDISSDIDLDLEDDLLSVSRGTSGHVSPLRNSLTPPRSMTPLRRTPPRSLTPPAVALSQGPKIMGLGSGLGLGLSPGLEFPQSSPESFSGANPLARQSHISSEGSHSMRSSGSGLSGSGISAGSGLGVAALGLIGLGAVPAMDSNNPMRALKPVKEEVQKVAGGSSPPVESTVFPLGSPSKAPPIALPAFNVSGDTAMTSSKSPVQGKSRPTSITRSATNVAPVFSSSRPGSMSTRPVSMSGSSSVSSSRPGTASSRPSSVSLKQGLATSRSSAMSRPTSTSNKHSTATATSRASPVTGQSSRPQSMSVMRPLSVSTLRPTPVSPSARPLSISSRSSSISNASRHFTSSSASSRPVSMNLSGPWTNSATPSYAPAKTAVFSPLTASTREKKEMMERLTMLSSSAKPVPYKSKSPKTSGLSTPVSKSGPRVRPVRDPLTPSSTILKTDDQQREREDSPLMWLTVLDLTERNLDSFSPVCYSLYPKHNFENLKVLILRDNKIIDLLSLELANLGNLTDLDLAFNKLSGAIPRGVFPQTLERLDLSGNDVTDVCNLSYYTNLLVLNVSNNCLKDIAVYPCNLTELDISLNLISNVIDLRILALSPSIKVLHIVGNPVVDNSKQCKVTVCSVLPRLMMLDDMIIPSRNARLKNGSYSTQSSKDKSTVAAMTKRGQERADLARCRNHSVKLREIEEERERKSRLIDDRARWTVNEQRSPDRNKHHNDYNLSDDGMSCNQSQSNLSRGSSRRGTFSPGTPGKDKGNHFSAFGGTRFPTHSRKEVVKGYQTVHVYTPAPANSRRDPATLATHQRKYKTAVSKVNKWLLDSIQELGRASMVLGLAFWITEQPSLGADSQSSFSDAMLRIPFLKSAGDESINDDKCSFSLVDTYLDNIAAAVNCGVGDSEIQHSLEMAVESSKENLLAFQSVLRDIEEAIIRAHDVNSARSDVVFCLRREIEDVMYSPKGQQLNDQVLAPFGCELVWETSISKTHGDAASASTERVLRSPTTPWNPKLDYSGVSVSSHGHGHAHGYRNDLQGSQEPLDLTVTMDDVATKGHGQGQGGRNVPGDREREREGEGDGFYSDSTPHSDEFPSYNPSPRAPHESASSVLNFKHGMSQSGDSIPSSKENSGPPSTIRSLTDYPPYDYLNLSDFNDNLEEFSGEDE